MNDRDTVAQWRKKGYCVGGCRPVDEMLAILRLGDDGWRASSSTTQVLSERPPGPELKKPG